MAGTRGAQLRQICNDLKRICQHPFMLPEFEPERPEPPAVVPAAGSAAAAAEAAAADAEYLSGLLAHSAKLQLLDSMLEQLKQQGKQVMVMAHSTRVSEVQHAPTSCSVKHVSIVTCRLSVPFWLVCSWRASCVSCMHGGMQNTHSVGQALLLQWGTRVNDARSHALLAVCCAVLC